MLCVFGKMKWWQYHVEHVENPRTPDQRAYDLNMLCLCIGNMDCTLVI